MQSDEKYLLERAKMSKRRKLLFVIKELWNYLVSAD